MVVAVGVSPFTYLPVTAVRIEESQASDLDLDDLARQATDFLQQDLGLTSAEGVERALTLFIGGRLAPTRYRHSDIMATALEVL